MGEAPTETTGHGAARPVGESADALVESFPGGTVHPVTRWGAEVMHRPARPVISYDEELRTLVADLVATMYAANGVGLAACQIGVDLAVFVYDCPDADGAPRRGVICNPELTLPEDDSRRLDVDDEGCLSYPGAYEECARPDRAEVHGTDADGSPLAVEGDGLLARCLQHETDHTRGMVFGDRLPTRARKRLRKEMESVAGDYPPEWPVGARARRERTT